MKEFKDTLLMPVTEFKMRGNLGVNELDIQKYWEDNDVYNKRLLLNKDSEPFILHDGPPYANGNIHIGHAFQKTLKDFVLRFKSMQGFYTPYIPGWDTHGLPIENEVTKKGVNRKEMSIAEFRAVCREYALKQVDMQRDQFKRIGILGEWEKPYITLDKTYIADQIRLFGKLTTRNLVYQGLKPVYWSPSSESAFAEAEIEYMDKESNSIYVSFKLESEDNTHLLIWTTTPWTLPANLAVSVNPNMTYVKIKVGKISYILAESLLGKIVELLNFNDYEKVLFYRGTDLEGLKYHHPLFDKVLPVILGDHVTDTDGTGLVHTAPGHGVDDYNVGKKYNLDVLSPVDGRGIMTSDALQYEGMFYEKANDFIIEDLEKNQLLLHKSKFMHSYPHDWRTHKPVIFRATPQWFLSVEALKTELLDNIDNVSWVPSWGKVRLANMIENRDDWVISRQRHWGVPLPIFYAEDNTPILDVNVINYVASLFEEHGSDIWYEWDADKLLPSGFTHECSPNSVFRKENDIMDVWFDSGSSYQILERRGLPFPADLYLEGSDQYRGWFNSSLITSVAINGVSPYKQVLSHGFVLDGQGRKMSKSLGNTIDPLKLMKEHGADILRLWVATTTYQADVRISDDVIKQIAESYRKIRNTIRFILGNLHNFNLDDDYISYSMRSPIHKVMTMKLYEFSNEAIKAYESYDFDRVYRLVMPFIINDLSAFYLDYAKDVLYIEAEDNFERRTIQSTLYDIINLLLKLLTPIIPHTTEEAYQALEQKTKDSIYLTYFPKEISLNHPHFLEAFDLFEELRTVVLKKLEEARNEKVIGKSLQAHLDITIPQNVHDAIQILSFDLKQILMVAHTHVKIGNSISVDVSKALGHTCARCWNVLESVNDDGICERCANVLEE